MEKNQIIGLTLMFALIIGYSALFPTPDTKPEPPKAAQNQAKVATAPAAQPTLDSVAAKNIYGDFAAAATGQAQDVVIENDNLKVTFSTQGGKIKEVLLKKYKTYDQKPLYLVTEKGNKTEVVLPTNKGKIDISNLFFSTDAKSQVVAAKDSAQITFKLALSPTQSVTQTYTLKGNGYMIDYDLNLTGIATPGNDPVTFNWQNQMGQFENDLNENRKSAVINLWQDNDLSDTGLNAVADSETQADAPVQWFTFKHKYFLAGFIAKHTGFANGKFSLQVPTDSSAVKTAQAQVSLPMGDIKAGKGQYAYYFGPNDYQLLKEIPVEGFDRNVYLGYAFVKPLNKYFFVPLFTFFEKYIGNYGILIICLVLFVKILLTPLVYKSYISMAKMRVLAPELEEIKKKVGDDAAAQQQEQMKLYQEVGVSPLSGCVPVLATMPVLMSLFFLFPNLIELRQKSFLWSHDLATYDSIVNLPFTVPFYGSHVSLFTLLMTVSQVVYAWYNNQITPAQPNSPVNMKALGYVMPVVFMFVMNTFAAGLSWYYFVSNVVTVLQQQIIRKFVDETKIRKILDETRVKIASGEKKKSKFSDLLDRSMKAAEEAKKKTEDTKQQLEVKKKTKK